jgi:signal transduction histidine kinase/CheY-like chemotaxis protein
VKLPAFNATDPTSSSRRSNDTTGMKSLFRRYLAGLSGLVSLAVLLIGALLSAQHYSDDRHRIEQIQVTQAQAASASIQEYLRDIRRVLTSLAQRVDEGAVLGREAQANDFRQALKFQPAILNIRTTDRQFRETNFVSRNLPDRAESLESLRWVRAVSACQSDLCFGSPFIRDQTEPYIRVVVPPSAADREILAAEISLRFIDDVLLRLPIEPSASAYVVDSDDRMLAHPDLRILLQNSDVSGLAQVQRVRTALRQKRQPLPSTWGRSPAGGDVFTSASVIAGPQWLVFIERPAAEVLSAVWRTIEATVALLIIGLGAAYAASMLLARRLARPIMLLKDGAMKLGAGDWSSTIEVHTGDEIESVALAFNQMADRLRGLYGNLETQVAARTEELARANTRISAQAQELATLNSRLERQVVELNIKRLEADRANAAKTRFVAAASHDLRQPMHAVGLLVSILADRETSPDAAALLGKIQLSVAALESLFGALLDISKLDAGIVQPTVTCLSLGTLLKSVEFAHAQQAADKGLKLRVIESRTMVLSDAALLLSIVSNLVANAIRYTERGVVHVYCRKSGGFVDVLVADSGIGIPADHIQHVFEEFYQVAEPGRDRSQGLGLGLAIVQRTSELLGHELIVRSSVGAGSLFGVRVPIADLRSIQHVLPTTPVEPDARLGGAFVVLIDDDEESLYATRAIFASWQCHVISGSSAEAVRNLLSEHLRQPDLIVADYWLRNGVTGLAVIEQLRQDAEMLVPAILLTADYNTTLPSSVDARALTLLRKPANGNRIHRAAIELLRMSAASPSQVTSS